MEQTLAFLRKEWIKVRWPFLILIAVTGWVVIDVLLQLRQLFEFIDPTKIWESVIHRQQLFYTRFEYVPAATGITIALAQFIPETLRRRLRLLFHLPVGHHRALYTMIAIGLAAVTFVSVVGATGILLTLRAYFPTEVVTSALHTMAPWALAGPAAYLAMTLVLLEPAWWRKVLGLALVWCLVQLLLDGEGYCSYDQALWRYGVLALLLVAAPALPAFRFKLGGGR